MLGICVTVDVLPSAQITPQILPLVSKSEAKTVTHLGPQRAKNSSVSLS